MAKKCINISKLYQKLNDVLSSSEREVDGHSSERKIDGYSLFDVSGGWRGEIELTHASETDWQKLCQLRRDFQQDDFKDIIKPIFEQNRKKYVTHDEASIILRILFKSDEEIKYLDGNEIIEEILEIFDDIVEVEKSLFYTLKKLDKKGSIEK